MAIILRGDPRRAARLAAERPEALVICVGDARKGDGPVAHIGVSVRSAALARKLEGAMTRALKAATATTPRATAIVRVRSRKAAERLGARVAGAIAVVPVTARNVRRVGEIVESLRAAGAAGVQVVWDGREPPREAAEASVFAVLERARATPAEAPVVLASGEEPVESLRILIENRR
jgi:hypothetical protein